MAESSPLFDPVVVQHQPEPAVKNKGSFTDHLANERTFLAWTRTSLCIFALGCAIARFSGTDDIKITLASSFSEKKPMISGLILVVCGIVTLVYGIWRYYRINRQIDQRDLTAVARIREPVIVTLLLLLSMITILVIFII
jgi:putative membrane protein